MLSPRRADAGARAAGSAGRGLGAAGHGGAFLGALLLIVVWTWPLAREPFSHLPEGDAWLFSWVMQSIFRNLVHQPAFLLHGNAFYPLGQSLTFAEPLLTPALLAGPLFLLTGNPVLAYNLTLVLLWALSGWATYAVARWITGSSGAGLVAMLVFTLAPTRIEYIAEFQMEMTFGIPLAVYAWIRFLEGQRMRHLLGFLVAFWAQAVAVWYYAVMLGVGLAALGVQYAALHWRGWRPRALGALGVGGAVLGLALAPVAAPFFVTRAELGFERGLGDVDASRYADVVTYLEARNSWLWHRLPFRSGAETSLFVGAVALVLASLAVVRVVVQRPRAGLRVSRLLSVAMGVCILAAIASVIAGRPVRIGPIRSLFTTAGVGVLLCLFGGEVAEGAGRWRAKVTERRLSERDWVRLLAGVLLLTFLLSLGPVVHAKGRGLGGGLFAWVYPLVFPLHAIRSPMRFGLIVLFVTAMLAGLGFQWLERRIGPRVRTLAGALTVLVLLAEYASVPYPDVPVRPRAVDTVLAADPADVAVLEWPLGVPGVDADAEFRSIWHGKRVVNGFAGFTTTFQRELSDVLSKGPELLGPAAALGALREIYALRYLLVRPADLPGRTRESVAALRRRPPALFRFRGTFEDVDLYEMRTAPEVGRSLRRLVSYDFLVRHPVLHLSLAPRPAPGVPLAGAEEWVSVLLNHRPQARIALREAVTTDIRLSAPLWRALPNEITLVHEFRSPPGTAFAVGATDAKLPGYLRVRSGGQPYGDLASIRFNGAELAANQRGYNVAALAPDGHVVATGAFDTFLDESACPRLAAWIERLSPGSVVAGAAKDEASARLCPAGIAALRRLGVRGDLRGHYRESHAFVGVLGAAPGEALEAMGPRLAEIEVGRAPTSESFVLRGLELRSPDPRS